MPLAVVSYPFGVERIVDFDGDVYRIPNEVMEYSPKFARREIEQYRLHPRKEKRSLANIRFAERYDDFHGGVRQRIDVLRGKVKSYTRSVESIAQQMMKVVTESCDVFLTKRRDPIDFFDYLAPAKIIRDLQGYVTDFEGHPLRDDAEHVDGLLVASRTRTHEKFFQALNEGSQTS